MALAASALAQGYVEINNSTSTGGPTQDKAGNYYGGPYGLEVWELNAASVPSGINNAVDNAAAYAALTSAGFTKYATFTGKTIPTGSEGLLSGLGTVQFPTAPKGGNVVIALAMWTGSGNSYGVVGTKAGVLSFVNPTTDYTIAAPLTPQAPFLTGWATDLVMTPVVAVVPEPSTFALAGLGAAALMIFRRRK